MRNTCSVDLCDQFVVGRGLCRKHYNRMRNKGDVGDLRKNAAGPCSEDGCEKPRAAWGLCDTHYRRLNPKRRGPIEGRTCTWCGAELAPERRVTAMFCSKDCKSKARVMDGRARASSMRFYFKSRYGLTPEKVEEMAAGGCGICGTTDWPGRHSRPHVDHNHSTGAVRGILCSECNTGLGKFRDDPAMLQKAIDYLTR